MAVLRNLRRIEGRHGPEMHADFNADDGRLGSISVPLAEYEAHGEAALQQEADACARQARAHGYRPSETDRLNELG